jgi:NAD(P)H-dependent FMN reductase
MPHIAIVSASVRLNRSSHRVALFFEKFITRKSIGTAEILDLNHYQFPIFEERLAHQKDPAPNVLEFSEKIRNADGVLIVTPEYNGGYPASLKNVVDLLYKDWYRKPLAVATVSDGSFGGTQVITSLLFTLWKIKAWVAPAMFPVPNVNESFDETGKPKDEATVDKRATAFLSELQWCMEAKQKMR